MAKNKWFDYKKLNTADKITIGVIGGAFLAEILFADKFKIGAGMSAEIFSTCPKGQTYNVSEGSCVSIGSAVSTAATTTTSTANTACPSGYTYDNGVCNINATTTTSCPSGYTLNSSNQCIQNASTSSALTASSDTLASTASSSSANSTVTNEIINLYAQYFGETPSNNSGSTYTSGIQYWTNLINNGESLAQVESSMQQIGSTGTNQYDQYFQANNPSLMANSSYSTSTTVNFSGSLGNATGMIMSITGSGNTLTSQTDTSYGLSNNGGWVNSGTITYDPSSGFSGELGNINGSLMIIQGSGNTLTSQTNTTVPNVQAGSWVNSGTITYDPTSNTFSGTLGDIAYSMFAIGGSGSTLVSQTNTYPHTGTSNWVSSGTITAS
ncbi:MAG: hypothetical protein ACYDDA_05790 [Acidiferrobacteraceae bacterium]